jgi:hypothetical protein
MAIQTSQHLVVVWSQHAERSRWVARELGVFEAIVDPAISNHHQEDRRFIFLMLEGDNPAYSGMQMINDFRETNVYAGGRASVSLFTPRPYRALIGQTFTLRIKAKCTLNGCAPS